MTSDYWKEFWLSHAKTSRNVEPQVQVLRTLNKRPISRETFKAILDSVVTLLQPGQANDLLDLCCGNGVITVELAKHSRSITAVDLSEEFISQLGEQGANNVKAFASDARIVEFPEGSFDRILLYAGIQYFSDSETVDLFMRLKRWLRSEGIILLGDIPDVTHRWNFFDSSEREAAYFKGLMEENPIVGNWFAPVWLTKLADFSGFSSAVIYPQPQTHPYRHYRFDLVLKA